MHSTVAAIVLVACTQGLAGCSSDDSAPTAPSSPGSPAPSAAVGLKVFIDPRSGFSTSELRDADEQVVQFNWANELIWADGTRLPGYSAQGNSIPAEGSCACWLIVRFGTSGGERRAYLSADYGHDTPGTLVDLEIAGNVLVVNRTDVFAPGTYSLSGVISEMTDHGLIPVEGADVWRTNEELTGSQVVKTAKNGFYVLGGLYDGGQALAVTKDGYQTVKTVVTVDGDTRFDSQLVRR